jgi:hypothetical protein
LTKARRRRRSLIRRGKLKPRKKGPRLFRRWRLHYRRAKQVIRNLRKYTSAVAHSYFMRYIKFMRSIAVMRRFFFSRGGVISSK